MKKLNLMTLCARDRSGAPAPWGQSGSGEPGAATAARAQMHLVVSR